MFDLRKIGETIYEIGKQDEGVINSVQFDYFGGFLLVGNGRHLNFHMMK